MTARIIDGVALSQRIREEVAQRVAALAAQGARPGLAVVLVGEDPASQVYVRNKVAACEKAGLHSVKEQYPADMTEADLLARIDTLNRDPAIHGILVQLPLPAHGRAQGHRGHRRRKGRGRFPRQQRRPAHDRPAVVLPCTPYGVMKMLESEGVALRGAEAVIVGASNIVGKPMAMLLLQAGATITICNSKTRDLAAQTRRADVLKCGDRQAGHDRRLDDRRAPSSSTWASIAAPTASCAATWTSPPPARWPAPSRPCRAAGPMTIAMLLVNTVEAAERAAGLTA